jgi:hypothetical protein
MRVAVGRGAAAGTAGAGASRGTGRRAAACTAATTGRGSRAVAARRWRCGLWFWSEGAPNGCGARKNMRGSCCGGRS